MHNHHPTQDESGSSLPDELVENQPAAPAQAEGCEDHHEQARLAEGQLLDNVGRGIGGHPRRAMRGVGEAVTIREA
jgi:hypothetical protein